MSRSDFILGNDIFIKVVSLTIEEGREVQKSLINGNVFPFKANEFLINYLITLNNNNTIDDHSKNLLSPQTMVLVSTQSYFR